MPIKTKAPVLYLDKKDVAQLNKDLKRLSDQTTKNSVVRSSLKKGGRIIRKEIKKNVITAFDGGYKLAPTFVFKQGTKKKAYVTVWVQSDVKIGTGHGKLTTIFENGTDDRYTETGWWTGKIKQGGSGNGINIKLEFVQRAFNDKARKAIDVIVRSTTERIDSIVSSSKKLIKIK